MVASTSTCVELHTAALEAERKNARKSLHDGINDYSRKLQALLGTKGASSIGETLGGGAELFLDTNKLAATLHVQRDGAGMEAARRDRLLGAVATLERWSSRLHPPVIRDTSFAGAMSLCEDILSQFAAVLRALRLARLECESGYDPALHDVLLASVDWHSAKPEELAAVPVVVVVQRATEVRGSALDDLGKLLRSGYPVQVLILWDGARLGEADLGWFSLSQREAYVLQSATSEREHLEAGLVSMASQSTTAVAIISEVDSRAPQQSHAFPLYRYDPNGGPGWADALKLWNSGTADADELRPAHVVFEGIESARHFEVILEGAWEPEQMELGAFLSHSCMDAPRALPFIWVWTPKGERRRALLSREVVAFSRERMRSWRLLQEMAGIRNNRAELVIAEALKEAQESSLARERQAVKKAEQAAAAAAIHRLVAVLTNTTVASAVELPGPLENKSEIPGASERTDPYIDSFLCTSCNDCMKINNRMFSYNADKQAYIADPRAGSFAELVKAAEGCPAKCIHPGSPRAGDLTASAAIIARAKRMT